MSMRFNPPPGWPPVQPGWTPPHGWQPDPSWPAMPPGWPLWVEAEDATAASLAAQARGPRWALLGAAAVLIGAFLPLMSNTANSDYLGLTENGGAEQSSAFFGVLLLGLAVAIKYWSVPGRLRRSAVRTLTIALLALSSFGILGYGGFAIAGMVGVPEQTDLFGQVTVTFSPGIGLVAMFLGCVAVTVGAVRGLLDAGQAR